MQKFFDLARLDNKAEELADRRAFSPPIRSAARGFVLFSTRQSGAGENR